MYTSMFRKAMLGDTATLNLDFTTGVLDSRLTFTRAAGTATYINSSGYVTTATANTPRFDYDPLTLAPRGLLIEGSAINLMTYSEDQGNNSTWNAYSTSVTRTTGQTDPENTTTATKILFDATTADAVISRSVTISNATAYTISVWMRADSGTVSNVRFGRAASAGGAIFPTLTTTWQRVQLAFTSSGTSDGIEIRVLTSGSPKTATIHIWGAQLEAGSGASSYIPTVASQVTRNGDSCVMSNISSLSYSSTNGSMVYCGRFSKINSASYPTRMGFLTNDGGDPAFEIFTNATTIFSGIRSTAANNEITRTIAINTDYKFATAFNASAASQVRCSLNGAAAVGSSTSALTATRTPTVFGFTRSGYELYFPCGTIKAAKYYNTTLTDAELVSQST